MYAKCRIKTRLVIGLYNNLKPLLNNSIKRLKMLMYYCVCPLRTSKKTRSKFMGCVSLCKPLQKFMTKTIALLLPVCSSNKNVKIASP